LCGTVAGQYDHRQSGAVPGRFQLPLLQGRTMLATVLLLALSPAQVAAVSVTDVALRDELLKRMKADQDVRLEFMKVNANGAAFTLAGREKPEVKIVLEKMEAIDKDNLNWFKGVVRKNGWPGKAMVGGDGAQGAFLIAQHATTDLEFMAECHKLLIAAHRAGDAEGQWVALLTDRLLILKDKKKQLYGSQLESSDGKLVPQPIEDPDRVDERRKAMGMPPLADYLKIANGRQADNPSAIADEPGFERIFNRKDLTGWRHGQNDLAGTTVTDGGRFAVKDGVLVITGSKDKPPKMSEIDTTKSYNGDFTLRLEFRASREANSGLHLRDKAFAHQLQIRDYPRVGPYKSLKSYRDGGWNEIEVVVSGNKARCTCNGELLEAALEIPDKGPLSLQSETNVVEYRNIWIKKGK
jgi:hypothetical protein